MRSGGTILVPGAAAIAAGGGGDRRCLSLRLVVALVVVVVVVHATVLVAARARSNDAVRMRCLISSFYAYDAYGISNQCNHSLYGLPPE